MLKSGLGWSEGCPNSFSGRVRLLLESKDSLSQLFICHFARNKKISECSCPLKLWTMKLSLLDDILRFCVDLQMAYNKDFMQQVWPRIITYLACQQFNKYRVFKLTSYHGSWGYWTYKEYISNNHNLLVTWSVQINVLRNQRNT